MQHLLRQPSMRLVAQNILPLSSSLSNETVTCWPQVRHSQTAEWLSSAFHYDSSVSGIQGQSSVSVLSFTTNYLIFRRYLVKEM
mmetsp:Transcript_3625/g.8293  ORF Transcript_3625/g.8293 Transcript_3625/m.8293 type:complete len:84 (-) Transcript_3625:35-286(-)